MQSEVDFFDVELAKGTQGLGITIAGYVGEKTSGIAKLKMCRMKILYQRLYVKKRYHCIVFKKRSYKFSTVRALYLIMKG